MMRSFRIRSILPFLFSMLMISGIAYGQPVENLVINPGFEDGIGSPWWNNSQTHCFSDSQEFHCDRKSLRITVTDPETYVLVGQSVLVTPGESYDIGAWIKTENVTSAGAQICIEWYRDGVWLGGEWGAKQVTGDQGWQYTPVTRVKIPEEATSASVFLRISEGSTGTAWFDDIVVEKQVKSLLKTFILRPNYACKILPGAPSPEIRVEVTLNPEGHGLTLDELEIRVALKDKDETGNVIVQENLESPLLNTFYMELGIPADTPPGDYHLAVDLYKGAILLARDRYPIENLSQEDLSGLTSYIDSHNRFILNGEPFFPLGLYVVQCTNGSYSAELDEIANSPFDTLMNYAVNKCGSDATDAQILGYLNQLELESRNLKLIFSLKDYIGNGQEDIDAITRKVNTFKGHPAIIAWYLNDESGLEYLPELEARYQKVRELDKNHPVWSVNCRKYVLIEEAHTADVLGVDPYPIPGNPITMVSDWADWAKEAGRGYRPLWLVPQIFRREGHSPTPDEMRAMTYLAINHGAKGLIYYSYFDIRNDKDYKIRWAQIKEIASEIDRLRPVLLSTHQTNHNDIVCENTNIDFKLMREGNTYYLLAVNTKKDTMAAVSFRINPAHKPEAVSVLFEGNRQVVVNNGSFADSFTPYEVHVYRWQGSNGGDGGSGSCFIVTSAQESTMIGKVYNTIPGLIAATFMALLGIKMAI